MSEGILFCELRSEMSVDTTLVKDWSHQKVGTYDNVRIYHKFDDGVFTFYVINFLHCSSAQGSIWDQKDLAVEIWFAGYGFFDGIRHLYCHKETKSGDFDGYIYYPNFAAMSEIFSCLRKLELEHSLEPDTEF